MANEETTKANEETTKPESGDQPKAPPRSLPPLTSSRPVSGGSKLPPLQSAKPAGTSPAPAAPAQPAGTVARQAAPAAQPAAQQAAPAAVNRPPQPAGPTPAVRKPKQDRPPEDDQGIWRMNRKNFLNVAGWFAFFSFIITATIGAIRLMVPRVLYEPPSAFKAGFPDDFVIGEVNEKYKDEFRVWIVREREGFYALAAICTHLGCTPRWLPTEDKFKCPCHGSGYHKDGINFEGPTPRPLERLKITLADDGQILVDRNIKFRFEKGEWVKPDAFLKYS